MALPDAERRPGGADGPGGTIHDLGYRTYQGPRLAPPRIARSLFVNGYCNAFGVGRSHGTKGLPAILMLLAAGPALITVAFMSMNGGLVHGFEGYSRYPQQIQLFTWIFVAAQSQVLFSRDLRSGAISLYLARPLSAATFALVRWLSLAAAIFTFVWLPVLALYAGALGVGAGLTDQTGDFLAASLGIALLAALLATVGAVVSAHTKNRGLAVGGTIVALLLSHGLVDMAKSAGKDGGNADVGRWAGLGSAETLVDGIQVRLLGGQAAYELPPTMAQVPVFLLVAALVIGGGLWLLVRRYRKAGAR